MTLQNTNITPLARLFACGIELDGVERVLSVIRRHLGMDVAFVAKFCKDSRTLEHLDQGNGNLFNRYQQIPLTDGYCQKVVNGELPELIPDTSKLPATQCIPETHSVPIGSHLSVPIRLSDDRLYGTLCCFSHQPNDKLGPHDLSLLRAFSELLGLHFGIAAEIQEARKTAADEIRTLIQKGSLRPVFQPVYSISTGKLHGFECLSRFDIEPRRPPDQWFKSAHDVGMGLELERHAIDTAISALNNASSNYLISVNCSPQLILSGLLPHFFDANADLSRITLEITEHAAVDDYGALAEALVPLRRKGATLAVDDVGAGYSSMRHILQLQPDMIKLDISITQNVDSDRNRRALAKGLTSFAHEIGSVVVAEGVETAHEFNALAGLGVDFAQGYFISKPLDRDEALALGISREYL